MFWYDVFCYIKRNIITRRTSIHKCKLSFFHHYTLLLALQKPKRFPSKEEKMDSKRHPFSVTKGYYIDKNFDYKRFDKTR